jgi:hypothetical protein
MKMEQTAFRNVGILTAGVFESPGRKDTKIVRKVDY